MIVTIVAVFCLYTFLPVVLKPVKFCIFGCTSAIAKKCRSYAPWLAWSCL